jgi:bacterioferritin-associated ferredoxin
VFVLSDARLPGCSYLPLFRIVLNAIDNHSHLRLNQPTHANWLISMYVCICNAITDKQIRNAAKSGATDLRKLQAELGVATGCGSCMETASEILAEFRNRPAPQPAMFTPALA